MNKSDLVAEISRRTDVPASDVARVVDGLISVVTRAVVRGEKVVLSGFGRFHRQARAARTARNIWSEQTIRLRARNVPAFRPGKPFRDAVARRRATGRSTSR